MSTKKTTDRAADRSSVLLCASAAIATSRRLAERGHISTAWYVLRDLEATKSAGLSDLAWSGHQQGDVTERELNYFIAELEAWMKAPGTESVERRGPAGTGGVLVIASFLAAAMFGCASVEDQKTTREDKAIYNKYMAKVDAELDHPMIEKWWSYSQHVGEKTSKKTSTHDP